MKVYCLILKHFSKTHNRYSISVEKVARSENLIKQFANDNKYDLKGKFKNNEYGGYYDIEEHKIDKECRELCYIVFKNDFNYFQNPKIFKNEDEAILYKAKFEFAKAEEDENYKINSQMKLLKMKIE